MTEIHEVSRILGEMQGTLKAVQISNEAMEKRVTTLIEKHEERLTDLEMTHKEATGALRMASWVIGPLAAVVGSAITYVGHTLGIVK